MQLQITKNGKVNKFPAITDIESAVVPYLSFNNEYFLNLELSQETDYNFKINNKYFKVIQNLDNVLHLTDSFYKMSNVYPDIYQTMTEVPDELDTSKVTNMYFMFNGCYKLTSIPEMDISNVTNMRGMFSSCSSLTTIPSLDTSNVTNMTQMFVNCTKLTSIPQLDTSNVTTMDIMFATCTSLTTIPQLNTSKVTNMNNMFSNCKKLTTIPLLDTNKVTNMGGMFVNCISLTTIPQIDTSNITNISSMFWGCSSLTTIPQLNTNKITNMSYAFRECTSLPAEFPWIIDCSSIDTISEEAPYGSYLGMYHMFEDSSVTKVKLTNVKEELKSGITSQLLKGDDTLEIIFVDSVEEPINSDDWSLQFTLGTVESEVLLSNIHGFSEKDTPTDTDFYGENYDNQGRHLEIRYLGTQGNLTYAPDGVAVPNSCSSEEEQAAAINPDGYADYDPEAGNIMFSGGSAGTKVYMLVYHSEPFNS